MNYVFIKYEGRYPVSYRVDAWNNPTFIQAVGWNTPRVLEGLISLERGEYNTHLAIL